MKTIILIGIALALGCTVKAQGWVAAQGQSDGYAFNPYTMSKMPTNSENPGLVNPPAWKIVPAVNGNVDVYFPGPYPYIIKPNNDVNYDAMPKFREANFTVQHHKPY